MGIWSSKSKEPPPRMVLVPPLFDFPPLAARTRARHDEASMLESSYNYLFGKFSLKCLFEDYFDEARSFNTMLLLRPVDDSHVDLIATVSKTVDHQQEENVVGNAMFRWQSDVDDPNTFMDLFVSNSDPVLQMRSCAYFPKYGFRAFGIFPLILQKKRITSEDFGVMGLRYGSSTLSSGITFAPFPMCEEFARTAWLVSRIGRLTAGLQYEPLYGNKNDVGLKCLRNWSCAIGYALGPGSPLSPSFNFALELARSSQFIASFYQHVVVQRQVKNPLEENKIVGVTNYIDFGLELQTRLDDSRASNSLQDSSLRVAVSWQANKNFLLKGKVGPLSSTIALAFKSWWKPSFTFNVSATSDRRAGTSFGFGLRVENLREASYQRADPNYMMLTPSKEHLAKDMHWKTGRQPMLQSDVNSENFDDVPRELRPLGKFL